MGLLFFTSAYSLITLQQPLIYISFHPEDFNQHHGIQKAWIHSFVDTLTVLFTQSIHQNPCITLFTGDQFTEADQTKIAIADIFIIIMSPHYTEDSPYFAGLHQFVAQQGNWDKVFKVMKSDFDMSKLSLPEQLASLPAYEFFEYDSDAEIIVEYHNTGRLPDYKYWVKLDDLVHSIQLQLNDHQHHKTGVYVASSTLDQKQTREAIVRNLKHRGYEVYPKEWLDPTDPNLADKIKACLTKCSLSIHLMGEVFGEVINPEGDSLVSLENEIGLRYSIAHVNLKRLVWVPRNLVVMETKQQTYLEYLRSHKELQTNSFYLETSLENLKAYMHDLLTTHEPIVQKKEEQAHLFFAATSDEWLTKLQAVLKDQDMMMNTSADFEYWSEQQKVLGFTDTIVLADIPHHPEWVANWLKAIQKTKGYRTKVHEPTCILVVEDDRELLSNKNLAKFKLITESQFSASPNSILTLI